MRDLLFEFLNSHNLNFQILYAKYQITKDNQSNQFHRLVNNFFDFLEDKSDWSEIAMIDEYQAEQFAQHIFSSKTYKQHKELLLSNIVKTIQPHIVLKSLKNEDKKLFLTIKKCPNFIHWKDKEHIFFAEIDSQIENNKEKTDHNEFLSTVIKNNGINLRNIKNQTLLFQILDKHKITGQDKTISSIIDKFDNKTMENSFSEKTFETYYIDYKSISAVIAQNNVNGPTNIHKRIEKIIKHFSEAFTDQKALKFLKLDTNMVEKVIINTDGLLILSNEKMTQGMKSNIKKFSLELLSILEKKIVWETQIEQINIKNINTQVINYLKLQNNLEKTNKNIDTDQNKKPKI